MPCALRPIPFVETLTNFVLFRNSERPGFGGCRTTRQIWIQAVCGMVTLSIPLASPTPGDLTIAPSHASVRVSALGLRGGIGVGSHRRGVKSQTPPPFTACTSGGETISPCTSQVSLAPGTQSHQVFWVQNNAIEDDVVSTGCTHTGAITSCSASPTNLSLAHGGGEKSFTVTYTTATTGTSGTVDATTSGNGLTDARINIAVQYFTISTALDNNDDQDMSLCEASCFAALYAQSTVPTFSLDQPRDITLMYLGDQVAVRPFVYADVTPATGSPAPQQYWLQVKVNGTLVTFVNGEQTLHFSATGQERLAGQFDASYLAGGTGMYPYQVIVTAQYSTFNVQQIDSSSKLMVINERKSPIARGWSLAGIDRVYPQTDGSALLTDGRGSGVYFASCGSGCFVSPTGDFSKLVGSAGGGYVRSFVDSTKETFNTTGRLAAITDPNSDTVAFTYDSVGRLIAVTDPYRIPGGSCGGGTLCIGLGHEGIALTYGTYGLTSISNLCLDKAFDTKCRTTDITVAADSTLQAIEDPDSISTRFRYDSRRRLSVVVNRRGDSTRYVYRADSSWKLDSLVLPAVPVDAGGGLTTMQTPVFVLADWHVHGVPMTITGSSPAAPASTNSPSDTLIDPEGHIVRSTVDRWGEPLTVTDALGGQVFITRSGTLPTSITYPDGGTDSVRYSGGLPVWIRPTGADSTNFRYGSGFGVADSISGPNQLSQRIFVDAHGNVTRIRFGGADSDTVAYHVDTRGRITSIVDPLGHVTTMLYDRLTSNLSRTTLPNGGYALKVFDWYGRDSLRRVAGEPYTQYTYDAMNRVRKRYTLGQGDTITWTYDPLYLIRMQNGKGQVFRARVDALGATDTTFDPVDTVHRFTTLRYNRDRTLTSWTNERGQRVDQTWDALHRPVSKSGMNTTTDSLLYSSDGRITVGVNTVSRDSIFRAPSSWLDSVVTRFSDGKRYRYFYGHNSNLMLDSIRIASSSNISFPKQYFSYDARTKDADTVRLDLDTVTTAFNSALLTQIIHWGSGLTQTFNYTSGGLLEGSNFNQPLVDSAFWRAYDRDSTGRLASIITIDHNQLLVGGQWHSYMFAQDDYSRDPLGRILVDTTLFGNTCTPHGSGETCGSQEAALQILGYDAASNLTLRDSSSSQGFRVDSATYSAGNRLAAASWLSLNYQADSDGNIRRKYGSTTDIRYGWSADDRLVGDTVVATGATIGYAYNAFGVLVRRDKQGVPDRHYLWTLGKLGVELDGTDTSRVSEYAYPTQAVGSTPFAIVTGAASIARTRDIMQDALGNDLGVVDGTTVSQRREIDRWGNLLFATGTLADTNRLRWKGLLWEGDSTKLYYVQNRWYDPATGRFLSQDPLGLDNSANQYDFGENDQISSEDPLGTHPFGLPFGFYVIASPGCSGFPCIPGGSLPEMPAFDHPQNESGGLVGSETCTVDNLAPCKLITITLGWSYGVGIKDQIGPVEIQGDIAKSGHKEEFSLTEALKWTRVGVTSLALFEGTARAWRHGVHATVAGCNTKDGCHIVECCDIDHVNTSNGDVTIDGKVGLEFGVTFPVGQWKTVAQGTFKTFNALVGQWLSHHAGEPFSTGGDPNSNRGHWPFY